MKKQSPPALIDSSSTFTVLMTATIRPASAEVVLSNPGQRVAQYREALHFWLSETSYNVVFVENSGADLEGLLGRRERVEYISAPPVKIPEGVNYGYGELAMIDFALESSRTLRQTSHFIKATGRLKFPSINKVVRLLPDNFLAAVDVRRRPGLLTSVERLYRNRSLSFAPGKPFVAMQIMMFQPSFWDSKIRGKYRQMNREMRLAEDLLLRELYAAIEESSPEEGQRVLLRWPANLEPRGFGAHNGRNYGSLGHKVVAGLRASARVLAPNVWL